MTIVHIVLFEWKSSATPEQIQDACQRMVELQYKCIHPTSNKTYIKSATGGKNNSPEGHAAPHTHGFVVEFESEEDRDYYVSKDPEHQGFIKSAMPILQSAKVMDYTPGKF